MKRSGLSPFLRPTEGTLGPAGEAPAGPSLFQTLQERLGLKLAATKAAVQLVVIDSAARVPAEN